MSFQENDLLLFLQFSFTFFNPMWQIYIRVSSYRLPETSLQEKQSKPTHPQHSHLRAIRVSLDLMPVGSKRCCIGPKYFLLTLSRGGTDMLLLCLVSKYGQYGAIFLNEV